MALVLSHLTLRGRSLRGLRRFRLLMGVGTPRFWMLTAILLTLNFYGTVMIISASSVQSVRQTATSPWLFAAQQLRWTIVGLVLLGGALAFSVQMWRRVALPLFLLSLVPLAAARMPGISASKNGASRWIEIGGFGFQPSEFVKLTTILALAEVLTRKSRHIDDWRTTLRPIAFLLVPVVVLVMAQPNLGTTLIILLAAAAVITIAGIRARVIAVLGGAAAALALVAVVFTPFRQRRINAFFDLRGNLAGDGYQTAQAMVGFANGGWLGKGIGRSTIKWGYLPYPYNDYIFAVIGEELGLVGTLGLITLFVTFTCVGFSIAARAADRFSMLAAAGITAWIGGQAFLNMAAVTNVVPSTGVPLPFISFGGSAQIVNLLAVGILLNIARHPRTEPEPDPERDALHHHLAGAA